METPEGYSGPILVVTLKDPSIEQSQLFDKFISSVFPEDKPLPVGPAGMFANEVLQGDYTIDFKKQIEK